MANRPQTSVFTEFVVEKKDFKPVFAWNRVKSQNVYGADRQIPSITLRGKIDGKDSEIVLQGKPFSRFLQFMEIGKRRFMNMMYKKNAYTSRSGKQYIKKQYIGFETAQQSIDTQYPKVSVQKFKFLSVDGNIARITSDEYIGIPHTFVQEVIEKRLTTEGVEFTKESRFGGVNGIYTFTNTGAGGLNKVGDIAHQVSYMNRNSGDRSLKLFGGAVVLVCSNGMTSGKATSEMRIVHKLELKDLRKRIEQQLGTILEKVKILPKQFLKLRKYEVTKEEAKKLVDSLPIPKYLQEAIWSRLFTPSKLTRNGEMDWDGTMWGLYMASTFIASHYKDIQKTRNTTKAVDETVVERLSSLELFTEIWDKREKILEATKAPKMESK